MILSWSKPVFLGTSSKDILLKRTVNQPIHLPCGFSAAKINYFNVIFIPEVNFLSELKAYFRIFS